MFIDSQVCKSMFTCKIAEFSLKQGGDVGRRCMFLIWKAGGMDEALVDENAHQVVLLDPDLWRRVADCAVDD